MEEALKDERFNHILTDPRFRKIPRNVRKIKVDKRFKDMFEDTKFKEKSKVDKRGRQLNLTPSENLKKLYNITSESSDEETEIDLKNKHIDKRFQLNESDEEDFNSNHCEKKQLKSKQLKSKTDDKRNINEIEISNDSVPQHIDEKSSKTKKKLNQLKVKDADAEEILTSDEESNVDSDSSSESSEDSEDSDSEDSKSNEIEEFDHRWEELQEDAPDANQITKRLAVCNMDWDRIRAEDLMSVFNSFKPADGCIYSVKIYPSEYGLKRMEEEKLRGPQELVEKVLGPDEEEKDNKKGSKYNREKLRQYQINRLKYYYAVIETDSAETANILCEQLNGMEYESCSVRFDIRFIPDDTTFEHEPTSVVDKVPDPSEYKPRLFVTTALQQVNVNLTWDETDPKRRETLQKAFTEPDSIEKDIKDYLASTSGESEDENEDAEVDNKLSTKDRIAKYKALLQSLEEKEKNEEEKYDMEITWDPELKEKTEEIVKEKLQKDDNLNPFEEMLKKKKDKTKMKKKEKKMSSKVPNDNSDDDSELESDDKATETTEEQHKKALAELALMSDSRKINLSNEKKKKRNKKTIKTEKLDNFQCDVNDPRFSAIYSSHLYNLDPSDPHFKKTPGNMAILQEKQKKLKHAGTDFETKGAKKLKYNR